MTRFGRPAKGSAAGRLRLASGALVVATLLVALRVQVFDAVFRDGGVVLLANDPHSYRFVVERLVGSVAGPADVPALLAYDGKSPVLVVPAAWVAELFGGGPETVGVVLAWYPVFAAAGSAVLVGVAGDRLAGDVRGGLLAAAVLAVTPVHAFRTALGNADHHAFDYLWLAAVLLGLLATVGDGDTALRRGRRRWVAGVLLGAVLAGQLLAWSGAVVLLVPVGLVVVVMPVHASGRNESPLAVTAPLLVGLWIAALLVWGAHDTLGWHGYPVAIHGYPVAVQPAVLALTATAVTLAAAGVRHVTRSTAAVAVAVMGVTTVAGLMALLPSGSPTRRVVEAGLDYVRGTSGSGVDEATSLVAGSLGPIAGPTTMFGALPLLAVPTLVVATVVVGRGGRRDWIVVGAYTWWCLLLTLVQRRFAGELSVPVALLVGAGAVALGGRVGLLASPDLFAPRAGDGGGASRSATDVSAATPGDEADHGGKTRPDARAEPAETGADEDGGTRARLVAVGVVVMLVVTTAPIPGLLAGATIDDPAYRTARAIDADAAASGVTYPSNYVLARWDRVRMYNYVVNGQSESFAYAERWYPPFLVSDAPERWYERLRERPVGYVVTRDGRMSPDTDAMWTRLHRRLGSRGDGVAGLGRYRAVYASANGSVKAFRLVSGAILVGRAPPNATVRVRTSPSLRATDRSVAYARRTTGTANGWFAVRVAYPGRYRVGGRTVRVGETAVRQGRFVPVGDLRGAGAAGSPATDASDDAERAGARWPLDAGRRDFVFDARSGRHGEVLGARREEDARWVDTAGRTVLATDPQTRVRIPEATGEGADDATAPDGGGAPNGSAGFALSVRFRPTGSQATRFPRLVAKANASRFRSAEGYQLALHGDRLVATVGDGTDVAVLRGPDVIDGRWHRATLRWNGTRATLRLDGRRVDAAAVRSPPTTTAPLTFGASSGGGYGFRGQFDEVRLTPIRGTPTDTDERREPPNNRTTEPRTARPGRRQSFRSTRVGSAERTRVGAGSVEPYEFMIARADGPIMRSSICEHGERSVVPDVRDGGIASTASSALRARATRTNRRWADR